ncbi:hypothetical protein DWZ46_13245 [Faecalibacterium prausnitzii]|uniref:Uncharacterized protein n=1 Tax=Faecalibacterium prausnitzii TaxID=853 RepID=A0A3E2TY34_9FIRM|nr:hypothetical protein DWZ46_13245 [Faecalibacterium prausnitzii]
MDAFFASVLSLRHLSRKFKIFFAEFFLALLYTSGYNIEWYGFQTHLTGPMSGQRPQGISGTCAPIIEEKKRLLEVYL